MMEKEFTIDNKMGLHARPAALFAQTANKFKSEVRLVKDGVEVNAKSVMGLMMLAAESGSTVIVKVWGPDEDAAITALGKVFKDKFNEE